MKLNNVLKTNPWRDNFPKALKSLYDPPTALYMRGELLDDLEHKPVLAVVGSRKVSTYGRSVTKSLVQDLARRGVVIVSGLAFGVDSIAHQAALDVGGRTIAILPSGLDRVYPSSHAGLAMQILALGGTLLSEYPPGTDPRRENFIARNRLIAGLGEAVLITEAAERSGSLHTANFALDQGKTVLAVPGNITSHTSTGTNTLIKAGAVVVTNVDDIMHGLDWVASKQLQIPSAYSRQEQVIIDLLISGITDGSELHQKSSLAPAEFNQTLTMLEINQRISPLGNNTWRLN